MGLVNYKKNGLISFLLNTLFQLFFIPFGYLMAQGGNITVNGDWVNEGTFTAANGSVTFGGTTTQTLSGSPIQLFNNLVISPGSTVSIPSNVNVTVNGTLTNSNGSAGLMLRSTSAGTSSLIHNTPGVAATTERYMIPNRWHVISFAVAGQSIPSFVTAPSNTIPTSGLNYGMMYYSEAGGGWVYYTNPASGNFTVGSGYLTRHTADNAVISSGILNSTQVGIALAGNGNGWNGIGNPYPCSIGVRHDASSTENFLDYNAAALDPSYAVLYLWDEPAVRVSGVSYYKVICNANFPTSMPILNQAYLQPGQGFLVKVIAGGSTVSFTNAMRYHENSASFFKSAKVSWPGMNLIVNSAGKTASTAITFYDKMTLGLDPTYDAGLLGGDPTFRVYSRLVQDDLKKNVNFTLQCLPGSGYDKIMVPVGLDNRDGGSITFSSDFISLPTGAKIFLVDSLLGKSVELSKRSVTYSTTIDPNTSGIGRFYLEITKSSSGTNPKADINAGLDVNIYSIGGEITVKGMVPEHTFATLYNSKGLPIKVYQLQPIDINILPTRNLPAGIYILRVNGNGLIATEKVMIEN